jgi:hypothetical protein
VRDPGLGLPWQRPYRGNTHSSTCIRYVHEARNLQRSDAPVSIVRPCMRLRPCGPDDPWWFESTRAHAKSPGFRGFSVAGNVAWGSAGDVRAAASGNNVHSDGRRSASCRMAKGRWKVRWRDASRRRRSRRFREDAAARDSTPRSTRPRRLERSRPGTAMRAAFTRSRNQGGGRCSVAPTAQLRASVDFPSPTGARDAGQLAVEQVVRRES